MKYRQLTFVDALQSLGQQPTSQQPKHQRKQEKLIHPPSKTWQMKAKQVIRVSIDNLWRDSGQFARDYLHRRGLTDETIETTQLGYIPGYYTQWTKLYDMSVPCGILIPWIRFDDIWALKVRRASGQPKYQMVKGSRPHIPYTLVSGHCNESAVICEGEFDAMLLHQETSDLVDVYTLGSASKRLNELNRTMLLPYRKVWLAYDNDEAGQNRVQQMMNVSARMQPLHIPNNGDITDCFLSGHDLRKWIQSTNFESWQNLP